MCVAQELETSLAKELKWRNKYEAQELAATAQQVLRWHAAKVLQRFWRVCLEKRKAADIVIKKPAAKGKKGAKKGAKAAGGKKAASGKKTAGTKKGKKA